MDVAFVTPTTLASRLFISRTHIIRRPPCLSQNHQSRLLQASKTVAALAPPQRARTHARSLKTAPPDVRPHTVPFRVDNPAVELEEPKELEAENVVKQEATIPRLKPVFTISELQKERAQRAVVMARRAASFTSPASNFEESEAKVQTTKLKSTSQAVPTTVQNEIESELKNLEGTRTGKAMEKNSEVFSVDTNGTKEIDTEELSVSSTSLDLDTETGYKSELCKKLDKLSNITKGRRKSDDVLRERAVGLRYETHEELVQDLLDLRGDLIENEQGRIVVYRGNVRAKMMVIGEAPGAQEDIEGLPFVGAAGQLLNRVFRYAGFDVEQDVYVTNVVKRRPRNNRDPTAAEIAYYLPILQEELRLVNPGIVVLAGRFAMKSILPELTSIMKARGRWFKLPSGAIAMPVLHPSYLLRRAESKTLMRDDVLEIRSKYLELYPDAQLADVTNQGSSDSNRRVRQ